MSERAEKIGSNEALFRDVNEEISELNDSFGVLAETMTVVCECGDGTCIEQINLSPEEYERLRSESELFVIVCGHSIPDVETVVERTRRYEVVRKDPGKSAEVARALDRRG